MALLNASIDVRNVDCAQSAFDYVGLILGTVNSLDCTGERAKHNRIRTRSHVAGEDASIPTAQSSIYVDVDCGIGPNLRVCNNNMTPLSRRQRTIRAERLPRSTVVQVRLDKSGRCQHN